MADDDDWENEALADQRKAAMTRDQAQKILQVNPTLRKQGVDTDFIVNQQAGKSPKPGASKAAGKGPSLDVAKDADHLLDLATQQYQQQKRDLESEISILQARLAGLKGTYLNAAMQQLDRLDRALASPLTQAALERHKAFLSELGFTAQKFMTFLRGKR